MASIEQIKSTVSAGGGFALPNQYLVELPQIAGSSLTAQERNTLCRTTRLPGRQISTISRDVGLMKQNMAIGYAKDDITMSFHVLNDYKTKDYFDKWQELIVDQEDQQIKYASEYKKTVKIYQLEKGKAFDIGGADFSVFGIGVNLDFDLRSSENVIYGVELQGSFPVTLNGIDLADGSTDQTIEVSISLSYKNWKRIK
jgi:hypothetical protein